MPVYKFARAISVAEGSNPLWCNPGDLTISLGFPNDGPQNADGVLKFVNVADGWYVLYHQCWVMLTGKSHEYALTDTIEQVGMKYSDGDPNWAMNVANYLGVPTSTTLAQLAADT
jgi:hypothetical protein